jgi:hypothetical protein
MSGGSKTQTTNTKQESTPWAPAIPAATNILDKANGLLNAGAGSAVYQGPRLAGLGTDTQAGLDLIKTGAQAGLGVAQSGAGLVTGLTASGGTTAATQAATAGLAGIDPSVSTGGVSAAVDRLSDPSGLAATTGASLAGGAYATDTAPVAGLAAGLAGSSSQTQRSLQDVADGKFLDAGNPYLEGIIARGANEAGTAVAQRFAASGRFGSGRFAGAVADAANRIGTEARYADYNAERGRQAEAAQAIDAAGNARAGLAGSLLGQVAGVNQGNASIAATGAGLAQGALKDALAGETTLAGLDADNITRRLQQAGALLSGAQSDRAAGLAAAGMVPTMQAALTQPGRDVATVGAARDAARQDEINAGRELFDEQQAAPWKPLGLAASLVYPAAGLGGTVVGQETKKVPQPSIFQQVLGLALAGADTASKFYGKV